MNGVDQRDEREDKKRPIAIADWEKNNLRFDLLIRIRHSRRIEIHEYGRRQNAETSKIK